MLKLETEFFYERELILIEGSIASPKRARREHLLFDTGASSTTITPEVADELGYGARDGLCSTRVRTVAGYESGYWLKVEKLEVLGVSFEQFPVHVLDLSLPGVGGLIGMDVLKRFNFEVRSMEQRILLEPLRQ